MSGAHGEFVGHEPCPSCGSRDNLARYADGYGKCFSQACGHYEFGDGDEPKPKKRRAVASKDLVRGEYVDLPKRMLDEETCRKFSYCVGEHRGEHVQAAGYHDKAGRLVAQKLRTSGKEFSWVGEPRQALLFGQHLWAPGGRKVVVTEGEVDAMSVSQVQGNRWPVVSVPNGAQGASKAIREQLEWLESFSEVVLMFDQDEPGKAAAAECAELLTPGKARIAELPRKDANELLVAGESEKLISALWQAKVYRPDGIVAGADLWDQLTHEDATAVVQYPWPKLSTLTYGLRLGEIVTLCAGSGIGKSTLCREIAFHLLNAGESVGYVALEETVKRTSLGLLSLYLNRPLHLGREGVAEPELREAFNATVGNGRFFLYDHFGSVESDNLISKIRQMVRGFGVQWIVLDHISIAISGLETDNERKMLDVAMTHLRSLAQELNVGIIVVSHLKRVQGRAFETGARVSLSDLRGSASLEHLSDMVIAAERNQQGRESKHILRLRVLKNRFSGDTGEAGNLRYDVKTGRLVDTDDPFGEDDDGGGDDGGAGNTEF